MLVASIFAQSPIGKASTSPCLFNKTHCSCRNVDNPGLCLRHQNDSMCLVDKCSDTGFTCDCNGTETCAFTDCNAWITTNVMKSSFGLGKTVTCELSAIKCLRRVSEIPVENPSKEPVEYRMVQFGPRIEQNMVNMSAFKTTKFIVVAGDRVVADFEDIEKAKAELSKYPKGARSPSRAVFEVIDGVVGSDPHTVNGENQGAAMASGFNKFWWNWNDINRMKEIADKFVTLDVGRFLSPYGDMHGKWDHALRLHSRWITLRMYNEKGADGKVLCGIYNTYGISDDGLGNMKVSVEINAVGGTVEFIACDDVGECKGSKGKSLTGRHTLVSSLSDGWCIRPLESNGNAVSVKFSNVDGIKGVMLQSPAGQEKMFKFGEGAGMLGQMNSNGLVFNGTTPEIMFNLDGIMVDTSTSSEIGV